MAVPFENRNFHKEMLKLAGQLQKEGKVPRLLLHSCCAPCSSNCIEVLSKYFMVTVFYYNPNISSDEEYKKRVAEQIRFIKEFDTPNKVEFIEGDYEPDVFFKEVKGLEKEPEGGKRCFKCYELRLRKTAELAKAEAYDYFTTTKINGTDAEIEIRANFVKGIWIIQTELLRLCIFKTADINEQINICTVRWCHSGNTYN